MTDLDSDSNSEIINKDYYEIMGKKYSNITDPAPSVTPYRINKNSLKKIKENSLIKLNLYEAFYIIYKNSLGTDNTYKLTLENINSLSGGVAMASWNPDVKVDKKN